MPEGTPLTARFVATASPRSGGDAPWYASWWLWSALALLSLVPFLATPLPPLGDLLSHMGRYHVMLDHGHSPFLRRYFDFHWQILPNMGQDLLMVPVGALLGAERGAIVLSALIPPAMVLGLRQLSAAVHGRVQPTALLALPFSYCATYLYGFMNYHTGMALWLWGMVFWLRTGHWHPPLRQALLVLIAAVTFVCHLAAWGLLAAAVGCFELVRAVHRHGRASPAPSGALSGALARAIAGAVARASLLALPVLVYYAVRLSLPAAPATVPPVPILFGWQFKPYFLASTLRSEGMALDLASLAGLGGAALALFLSRRARLDAGLFLLAGALFLLFLVIPHGMLGTYYSDARLLPAAWIALLVGLRFDGRARLGSTVALAAIALFSLRIGLTTWGWHERGRALIADLGAVELMPRGARVASLAPLQTCNSWPNQGLSHLASLAIVRRDAFTSSQWVIPGYQLMTPRYLPGSRYNATVELSLIPKCNGVRLDEWLRDLPRDKFDFVWLFRTQAPAGTDWLVPVHRGPGSTLYAIRRDGARRP